MKCKKCQKMAVLNAFDDGSCLNCGEEISTAYMPCDKVCESCSEKHKICQSCGETMDLKKIFGISELLTEYALSKILKGKLDFEIKHKTITLGAVGVEVAKLSFEYAAYLNETKLTPELVENLFEWTKQKYVHMNKYTIGGFALWNDGETWMFGIRNNEQIQTLADLARLTAAKPILLA